jgi:hypothetical protein
VTLLAGTLVPVCLVNGLDTKTTHTGDRFTAILDSNLVANGVVVASRGATLNGVVTKAENARKLTGRSERQIALTNIVINGAAQQTSTSGFQRKGASEGANTAKKTAAGAGLGASHRSHRWQRRTRRGHRRSFRTGRVHGQKGRADRASCSNPIGVQPQPTYDSAGAAQRSRKQLLIEKTRQYLRYSM